MRKTDLKNKFVDWLNQHGVSSNTVYWSRLSSLLVKRLQAGVISGSFPTDVANMLKPLNGSYWTLVEELIESGYVNYAIYLCELYLNAIEKIREEADSNDNIMTALRRFIEFLKSDVSFITREGESVQKSSFSDEARGLMKSGKVPKYDANEILAYKINEIIEYAIEASLFFDAELVLARQNTLEQLFMAQKPASIPARCWRNTQPTNPLILPDYGGNNHTRKVIKQFTGYDVSGKSAQITGYHISHIWGMATDPGFFTSLWNIALIPAWANHLMDIPNPAPNSLASQMQNTVKAICHNLYGMNSLNFGKLQIPTPPTFVGADVMHGVYAVSIICGKGGQKFGPIVKQSIKV